MTTKDDRSGVVAGSGSQASFATVVSFEVAYTGRVLLVGKGTTEKYEIGACSTPCTVAV